ncbi:multimeric flavodoxin WrbA [Catenulispora sp. MAP12-49]
MRRSYIATTGPLWGQGRLVNKIGSSFTSTATAHGGQESTILAMNNTFYHWGCIIVPPGELELAAVEFQTRRAIEIAEILRRGRDT